MFLFNTASQAGDNIANPGPVWAMSFSGSTLAAADGNGQTYLWNVNASSLTATSAGTLADPNSGAQGVGALDFSPNGKWLVTGDTNGRAYVWAYG
jgi:WD40 repeat protein